MKITTKKLVFGAYLAILAILLGGLIQQFTGIPTGINLIVGGARLNIDLTMVPLSLSGMMLGPFFGGLVGFVYDQVSFLFKSGVAWNPIFTLADMAAAIVPGIVFYILKRMNIKTSLTKLLIVFILFYGFMSVTLTSYLAGVQVSSKSILMIIDFKKMMIVNWPILLLVIIFLLITIILILVLSKKDQSNGLYTFDKIYLAIFLGILSRTIISAIGLYLMFGTNAETPIPFVYYLAPRLINTLILTPIITMMILSIRPIFTRYIK